MLKSIAEMSEAFSGVGSRAERAEEDELFVLRKVEEIAGGSFVDRSIFVGVNSVGDDLDTLMREECALSGTVCEPVTERSNSDI